MSDQKQSVHLPTQPISLNGLADLAHRINVNNGFYEKSCEMGTRLALIHSEVSEALEADRKLHYVEEPRAAISLLDIEDDAIFKAAYELQIKDKFEGEMAGTLIRVLDLCAFHKIDIHHHVLAELRYNSLRGYKHGKEY